uniref:hypothetical protein n=1 Tax=Aeromonas sp. OTU364 TaxID=3043864 RepID=UPI00313F314C
MQRKTLAMLLATHLLVGAAGFAVGIYTLPILIAPAAPSSEQVTASQQQAKAGTPISSQQMMDSPAIMASRIPPSG